MRNVRSTLTFALAVAFGLLAGVSHAGQSAPVSDAVDASRPFVVKIHADWYGICTALVPTWHALDSQLGDGARLVLLDVTDRQTLEASQAEARRLGIEDFFDRYKARTGTIGVLRGDNREKVVVLKGVRDPARYETAVARARSTNPS